ncbi:MAG: methylmalonyl Co-A mutase-associated GTPase MeaB [Acidimicrobiales bacterium]
MSSTDRAYQVDDIVLRYHQALEGDRGALARLISWIERGREVVSLLELESADDPDANVIGITGAPGAGKSTLTDQLVGLLRLQQGDVAVLAIDPTSPFSGGAILGDRVRMNGHRGDTGVYIRSFATRGHLGGLATSVPETVTLLEHTGFRHVIIETVGVGQVEVEIATQADTTVVVVNPGWGDSIQANKAGLMEIADIFVINKADRDGTRQTRRDLENMLELGAHRSWTPPIVETVASEGKGIDRLVEALDAHREFLVRTGERQARRRARAVAEFERDLLRRLRQHIADDPAARSLIERVREGLLEPRAAARRVIDGI